MIVPWDSVNQQNSPTVMKFTIWSTSNCFTPTPLVVLTHWNIKAFTEQCLYIWHLQNIINACHWLKVFQFIFKDDTNSVVWKTSRYRFWFYGRFLSERQNLGITHLVKKNKKKTPDKCSQHKAASSWMLKHQFKWSILSDSLGRD